MVQMPRWSVTSERQDHCAPESGSVRFSVLIQVFILRSAQDHLDEMDPVVQAVMQGSIAVLDPLSRPLAVLLDRAGRHEEARQWTQHAAERTGPGGAVLWARVGCRLDH
jgi:hypothetical protein